MEWATIVKNLKESFSFSFHEIQGKKIPTAYMPPLYAYILYFFSLFSLSDFFTVKVVLIVQCLFSTISVIFFFKILEKYFDEKKSFIFATLYMLFPLNFYSSTQISSVSFQTTIFIFFLYYFLNSKNTLDFLKLGFFSGLALLIRGEFWLLLFTLIFYRILTKNISIKNFLLLISIITIVIAPTLVRNYVVFEEVVLTKSSGYNLWRGNSKTPNINGETVDSIEIRNEINRIKKKLIQEDKIKKYEIYLDKIYLNVAKTNILNDPKKYFAHYIKKTFAFSFFNYSSNYPNYFHPLVIIPEVLISLLAIIGIILNCFSKKRHFEILMITFYYLALIPVFFVLPRYKLFILPLYFIFATYFFDYLSKKYFFKKTVKQSK